MRPPHRSPCQAFVQLKFVAFRWPQFFETYHDCVHLHECVCVCTNRAPELYTHTHHRTFGGITRKHRAHRAIRENRTNFSERIQRARGCIDILRFTDSRYILGYTQMGMHSRECKSVTDTWWNCLSGYGTFIRQEFRVMHLFGRSLNSNSSYARGL